ncbi:MAG: hypothetical protein AcusKO_26740 [Acuticoccus sp.]
MYVLGGIGLLVVVVLVRLVVAPLHLPLRGVAVDALTKALRMPVHVGALGVRLETGGLAVTLDDVRVRSDAFSASIERISLLQGLFGRSVRLENPAMRLDPSRGEPQPLAVPHPDRAVAGLDDALRNLLAEARRNGLRIAEVRNGRLDLVRAGRPIDEARVFQSIEGTVALADPRALTAALSAIGASGPIRVVLSRTVAADGTVAIALDADDITPRDFVNAGPLQSGFALSPDFSARLTAAGEVTDARLAVEVGPGTVKFGRDPPRAMDRATILLARAEDGRTLALERAGLVAGTTRIFVEGTLVPSDDPAAPWTFTLAATEAHLDPPDIDAPPVIIDEARASGDIDFPGQLVSLTHFYAVAPTARFDASLSFDFSPNGPTLAGAAHIGPSSIETLINAWPPVMAHEPRLAVKNTVLGGFVRKGDVTFALTPLELDGDPTTNDMIEGGMAIDIEFVGATLASPDFPLAVLRANGEMRMRDKTLSARVAGGEVLAGEGGALKVVSGAFTIPTLAEQPPQALLKSTVDGPLSAVVAIAQRLDVPELKKTPLAPGDVEGTFNADITLKTPLADDVPDSERLWEVNARLKGAATKVPVAGQTFSDGNIEVAINPRRLAARGRARIDGLAIDVNYSEVFNGAKSGAARFILTDKDRKARGFDTEGTVDGPVVVTLETVEDDTRLFTADLTDATVALPVFAKAAGAQLTASGEVKGEPGDLSIAGLEVLGEGGLDIEGSLDFSADGLERAAFSKFALADDDDARLDVVREGEGYRVTLDAEQLDGRRTVKDILKPSGKPKTPPKEDGETPFGIDLTADIDVVRLNDDATLDEFSVRALHDGKQLRRLSAKGRLNGVNAGAIAVELKEAENGTRRLQADIATLGRFLAALDYYGRMRGGRTTVDARLDKDGVVAGRLIAKDFVLADEATLEDILRRANARQNAAGRPGVPLSYQQTSAVDGLSFDQLVVDFTRRGDLVEISDATLRGPLIGGTASGEIDLAAGTIVLNGTIIPAYGVNNLFGRVPVLGQILGGGDKGGLIGVTFRIVGPIDSPQVLLNPMSAIAPGIFRRIFEFR